MLLESSGVQQVHPQQPLHVCQQTTEEEIIKSGLKCLNLDVCYC